MTTCFWLFYRMNLLIKNYWNLRPVTSPAKVTCSSLPAPGDGFNVFSSCRATLMFYISVDLQVIAQGVHYQIKSSADNVHQVRLCHPTFGPRLDQKLQNFIISADKLKLKYGYKEPNISAAKARPCCNAEMLYTCSRCQED